uniref:Uncharacterized protein n=1 Tax=Mycena chlorophos TaxID=658473 RepID=A0ABQ0M162_MYCCL|nr:predicted protein [Mycena chlorophos]
MSMPPPPREREGVRTRQRNSTIRPGVAAGLVPENPTARRTSAQVAADAATDAADRAAKQEELEAALARVAELEDKNRREDEEREKAAGAKPAPKPKAAAKKATAAPPAPKAPAVPSREPSLSPPPPTKTKPLRKAYAEDEDWSDSSPRPGNGDDDDYMDQEQPPADDESDVEMVDPKPKKAPRPTRDDILSKRRVEDRTGTPSIERGSKRKGSDAEAPLTKKAKPVKKVGGFVAVPKKAVAPVVSEELGSRPGGYALDDDENEKTEHPLRKVSTGGKMGKPKVMVSDASPSLFSSLVHLTLAHSHPQAVRVTQKSLRDGDDKWKFSHAPCEERVLKYELFPLMRDCYGGLHPWENPTPRDVQRKLDVIFTPGEYVAKVGEVWMGLIGYDIVAWRRKKVDAAKGAFDNIIAYNTQLKAEREEQNALIRAMRRARDERREQGKPALEGDDNDEAFEDVPEPEFDLTTKEGIAAMVEDQLKLTTDGKTRVYQWETYNETDEGVQKRGFLTTPLILETFASHLTALDAIPIEYAASRSTDPHYGALLLSVQAVEYVLRCWSTGEWVSPARANQFSYENWGDIPKTKHEHRASLFLATLKGWSEEKWDTFLERAAEWKIEPKRKRGSRAASVASSEAGDSEDYTPAPDFIVVDEDD